jgi:hypothetical protein
MFKDTYRSLLLVAAMLASGPAVAHATTTPASARAEQTISRFYSRADEVTVRQGFARTLTQRATLHPFFKTLLAQFDSGTVGDGGGPRLDVSISEAVMSYAQQPLIEQEESTAKQLEGATSGSAHKNAALLATYFADELRAAKTLPQFPKWESHRFYGNMPEAIQTLNDFVRSHGAFLPQDVDGGDLFRSAEPTLPGQQRTVFDLQARTLSQNTDSLALVIDGMARGWEGLAPGTGMGVTIKP